MANSSLRRVVGSAVVGIVAILILWTGASAATPARGPVVRVIISVSGVVVLLAVVLTLLAAAGMVVGARGRDQATVDTEEPLIQPPELPRVTRSVPVISLIGLESGAGTSTLAFNLAASIAAHGTIGMEGGRRLPRPVCILAEGRLTRALGLSAEATATYLTDHPGFIKEDILNLVVSHLAGLDLMCFAPGQPEMSQLPRLLEILRKSHDVVVVDIPCGAERPAAAAAHLGDAVLVCSLPTDSAAAAASNWALKCWELGEERRTGVVVNRVGVRRAPSDLTAGFLYEGQIPDDAVVQAKDASGHPWALDPTSAAALALNDIAAGLLPELFQADVESAA